MKISDFELELQKIDPNFKIIPHPVNQDMAGVYYKNRYQFAVPNGEIFEQANPSYTNGEGKIHRGMEDAIAIAKKYVYDLNNDPDFREMEEEVI